MGFRSKISVVLALFSVICFVKAEEGHISSATSLFPSNYQSCINMMIPSTTHGPGKRDASVPITHRYGACRGASNNTDLPHEFLMKDQARVESIKARLQNFKSLKATTLPVALDPGTISYVVEIGIGTPAKQLTLILDTGSDLTWTQCEPCKRCYVQTEPIFDPSQSTSYSNVSYGNSLCTSLKSATGKLPDSDGSTCVYRIDYKDKSYSTGFFVTETLTLSGTDRLENIPLGCGQDNQGIFGGPAGLIGLGRHPLSIVSQTAGKYHKVFSYCLPTKRNNLQGYLSFGRSGLPADVRYTTFSTSGDSFYNISITAITVGRYQVPLSTTALQSDIGSLIDSGTVITRLPPSIYNSMRVIFRNLMARYKLVEPYQNLDTCYDFSNEDTRIIPEISFHFKGDVKVDIVEDGILYWVGSRACLAFAKDDDGDTIFGSMQQQTMEVVYDVPGGRIGFAPNACS